MREYQTTRNKHFNLFIVSGLIFGLLAYFSFSDGEMGLGIGFGIFGLLTIGVSLILMPYQYRFDQYGVSICYLFLPMERYLWKNIHHIYVKDPDGRTSILNLFLQLYKIEGRAEGKKRNYMDGTISKTRRAKRLIEQYWDGTIEGYWDDCKPKGRKGKKQPSKALLTEEVVAMERNIRVEIRQFLSLYETQVRLYGMELRTEYEYLTEDYETLKSRPNQRYHYCVSIEISLPGETDEEKIWCAGAELLHVRPGKTSYKGVENKNAQVELREQLTEILEELPNLTCR